MSETHPFDTLERGPDAELWETLARWRAEGRRFVLLTVTGTRGFTPRKAGAHMLIAADGATFGSVGGGAIEQEATRAARTLLERGEGVESIQRHLTQELGMCCGGEMNVLLETITPAPSLVILGGGNIGRALVPIANGCGFRVTLVDERPEWADPERVPGARVECRSPEAFVREERIVPSDYVVVVTHDHALDQRLIELLLRRPLRFLGLVGSVPKQRKFALRLRARGFSDQDIARVRSPLGVAIGAMTPEEIAVSIAGELIAARRGVAVGSPGDVPSRHVSSTVRSLARDTEPAAPQAKSEQRS
jgi:xanthine dehydrogenase accessory factor